MDGLINNYIESAIKHNSLPHWRSMDLVYTETREGASFRRYVVHVFHYVMNGHSRNETAQRWWPTPDLYELMTKHPSLLKDYLELVRNTPIGEAAKDPRYMSRCLFHQHGENEECSLKK